MAMIAVLLAAPPCLAQPRAEAPVCQWGNCARVCSPACPNGYVCGVNGTCVAVTASESAEAEMKRQHEQEATLRRMQARSLTRVTLGIGFGSGEGAMDSQVIAAEGGVRQQLAKSFGLSAHLGLARVNLYPPDGLSVTAYDTWVDAVSYFGPFGRFYVGPMLAFVLRRYSENSADGSSTTDYAEGGGRLGVLLGSREQLDLWFQASTSFEDEPCRQVLLGFNFEFVGTD